MDAGARLDAAAARDASRADGDDAGREPDAAELLPDAGAQHAADAGGAPTFERIYHDILLVHHCDSYLCHGAGAGGLDLSRAEAGYAALVGVPSSGLECRDSGLTRVVAGDPNASLLLLKLDPDPPCGDPMPPSSVSGRISEAERSLIRAWIAAGAPR